MNIITAYKMYCLFPRTTFKEAKLHRFCIDTEVVVNESAYQAWHWHDNEQATTPLLEKYYASDFRSTRRLGDKHTWMITFTDCGVGGKSSAYSESVPDVIERNTFSMVDEVIMSCRQCRHGLREHHHHPLRIQTSIISSPVLRHDYACAENFWQASLGPRAAYETAYQLENAITRGKLRNSLTADERHLVKEILQTKLTRWSCDNILQRWHNLASSLHFPQDWLCKDRRIIEWYNLWWIADNRQVTIIKPAVYPVNYAKHHYEERPSGWQITALPLNNDHLVRIGTAPALLAVIIDTVCRAKINVRGLRCHMLFLLLIHPRKRRNSIMRLMLATIYGDATAPLHSLIAAFESNMISI